jgi:hypothetical protein
VATAVVGLALLSGSARAQDIASANPDSLPAWSRPLGIASADRAAMAEDTVRRRHAVEFSDAYYTRLKIHQIGSYAMLPLFAGEYLLGQRLLAVNAAPRWVKPAHSVGAFALGTLFTVNTVTGVWNLVESWHQPSSRGIRLVHSALMLASDAGFFYTATLAGGARRDPDRAHQHKNAALVSMSFATAGTLLMWFVRH